MRWGVGDAMGWETPRAPAQDSRCRGNDDGGVGVGDGWWLWGESRSRGTGDSRIAPTTGFGGVEDATGVCGGGAPPLWIPAFAGMTRVGSTLRVPSGQASTGSGRTDLGSARAVGSGGCDGVGDAPRRAPLDSRCRGNDACGKPFDRLRANGFGKRACDGECGMRGGGDGPRRAPALDSRCRGNDDWAMAGRSRGRWLLGWELRVFAEGDDDDAGHYEQGPDQHSPCDAFHAPKEDLGEEDGG